MKNKKFFIVARFEFIEILKKPSFWLATLFFPIFIGVISIVTGFTSKEAIKNFEEEYGQFEKIYIADNLGIIDKNIIQHPLELVESAESVLEKIKEKNKLLLVVIPEDFGSSFQYELIYKKDGNLLAGITMPAVINGLLKSSILSKIDDPILKKLLTSDPTVKAKSFDDVGNLVNENFGQYLLPIISLVIFFLAVFISSSFLLQSVSAEKENRMIETILSIIDKKSLMIGKMLGLAGVVLVQLLVWVIFSLGIYLLVQTFFDFPFSIDFGQINTSLIPVIIFLIFSGYIFFGAIMIGVGAIGTGAQDSKNLSSIFIILAVFPLYLILVLVTDPAGTTAQIFTYFPFTSHMILLFRYSLGAINPLDLGIALVITTIYSVIAVFIAIKLFELGCLMYNRRPSFKEFFFAMKK